MTAGHGALSFATDGSRTHVTHAIAHAPLKLLLPRNHGTARWAFAATYGGGLVDGDVIDMDVRLEAGTRAVLGTQASTKVYRSTEKGTQQHLRATVADDALLCVLPDPVVPFAGARYEQTSTYALAARASLVVIDVVSCGRRAHGERWAFARYASRVRIDEAVNDAVVLDAGEIDVARTMGRFDAFATIFSHGPLARLSLPPIPAPRGALVFSSNPDRTYVRAASTHIECLLAFVRDALEPVRAELGDDPFARKW